MLTAFIKFFFNLLAVSALLTGIYYQFISVAEGHVAFVKQRTLGWQGEALKPGIHYLWLGFVPTYYEIYNVNLSPPSEQLEFKKGLQYTDYLELSDVFRVQLKLRFNYSLTEKAAMGLLKNVDEDVNNWPKYFKERLNLLIESKFYEFYKRDRDIATLKIKFSQYFAPQNREGFYADWQNLFAGDQIQLNKWRLVENYVPDAQIYLAQVRNINQIFTAKRRALVSNIGSQAKVYEQKLFDQAQYTKALKFSELIRQNGKVVDYLAIEKLNPKAKIIVAPTQEKGLKQIEPVEKALPLKTETDENSVAPLSR